jgi:AdoMet-dependent heme synthase
MQEVAQITHQWTREELNNRPFIVIYEITRACHLACVHCRAEAQPHPHPLELRTDESLRLLDEIVALNPATLVLTGGDPLLRRDLEVLIRHAVASGLRVALTPSVTRKLTEAALTHLKEWGVSQVAFSLDGASASVHDGFRKVPGTFERTLRAMSWATEAGLSLQINTTVTKMTAPDLPGIARIAEQFAAQLWSVFFVVPTGRATQDSMLSASEHETIFEYLAALSQQVPFGIKATAAPAYRRVLLQHQAAGSPGLRAMGSGRAPVPINDGLGFVFISHIGDIYPNGFLPLSAGNVRCDTLADVYRNDPLFRALRDPQQLRGKCGACEFRAICGGSRARAFAVYGDPLESDPSCAYVPPLYTASMEQDEQRSTVTDPVFATHIPRHQDKDQATIGVMVMALGSPAGPDDIEAYYTRMRGGHPPTPALLSDLQRRYAAIGGKSPLLEHSRIQARGLQAALDQTDPGRFHVALGMQHSPPFIEDSMTELVESGAQEVVGLVLAPHYSHLSVGRYNERLKAANTSSLPLSMIEHWHLAPGYLDFLATSLQATLEKMIRKHSMDADKIEVLFTAHSLPTRILATNDPYQEQLRETAEAVASRLSLQGWSIAWQSAGRTSEPWIGPALLDVLTELPGRGMAGVVVCSEGFVSDHLEILYDLDIEARQAAQRLGLAFERTPMPNGDPGFLAALATVVRSRVGIDDGK